MVLPRIYRKILELLLVVVILVLLVLWIFAGDTPEKKWQEARKILTSIHEGEVTSFRIHPEFSNPPDYNNSIEFAQEEELVMAFFQAITASQPYNPQHDVALAQWGMQIRTVTTSARIGCYIPDLKPGVIVGRIDMDSGYGYFQSPSLLRWYQKYGHYWKIGDYQKVQYSRVKPILTSISPESITSFRIVPGISESSTGKEMNEFSQDTELVTEFFQTLEDMQFAAPMYKELAEQWSIQIHTGTTSVNIECSIPVNDPTVVVGLIDSSAGYSYFQSRLLFQWYQKYKDRWLSSH
jgi:hypothetical protein